MRSILQSHDATIQHILLIVVLFIVAVPLGVKLVNMYVRATRLLVISPEEITVWLVMIPP